MMMTIKKYWELFLDWEDREITFDNGWALTILVAFFIAVLT